MNLRKPRVLWIAPVPPSPALTSSAVRLCALAERLRERYELTLLSGLERGREPWSQWAAVAALERIFSQARLFPFEAPPPAMALAPKLARRAYSGALLAYLRERAGAADIVHVDCTHMAWCAQADPGKKWVLTYYDRGLVSWNRSYLPELSPTRKWLHPHEWIRQRRYHRWMMSRYAAYAVLNSEDRAWIAAQAPRARVEIVPQGVDPERVAAPPEGRPGLEGPALVFIGHGGFYPNEDALRFLARRVMPRLRRRLPAARLRAVGVAHRGIRALAGDGVEISGVASNVREALGGALAMLAPIRLGYGIQGQLLEALAAGIPVIAMSHACRNYDMIPGVHYLAAENAEEYVQAVLLLHGDPSLRQRLAAAGKSLASRFGWERSADALDSLYRGVLNEEKGRQEKEAEKGLHEAGLGPPRPAQSGGLGF